MNSFLSRAGIAARRKCDQLIKQGLISVNRKTVHEPGLIVSPSEDKIFYNSRQVFLSRRFTYILLNKPRGFLCTVSDARKRPVVLDLIESDSRVFPVGRLDMNTTGLLLITDDGELSHRLTHPKFRITKTYVVRLHKPLRPEHKDRLKKGVEIGKSEYVKAKIRELGGQKKNVEAQVHEGKNRMVRRMFESLGYNVKSLDRINFAGLTKRKLPPGGYRFLTKSEIQKLYKLVELDSGH